MRALPKPSALTSCEFWGAILLTLFLVVVHTRLLLHAGGLWRDEVNSLYVATTPTLKDFLDSLVFDPFPILFVSVLRIWVVLGLGNSDFSLRLLGFLIGTSLVGTVWLSCRLIGKERAAPVWPLALFVLNPLTIVEGDSLRGYGLGLIGILLSFALVWRLTFRPWQTGTVVAATIAALIAVQSLYLSSLVVFAICVAAVAVAVKRKDWARARAILAVGAIAALSLLPYAGILRRAHEQLALQSNPKTVADEARSLMSIFASGKSGVAYVWMLIFACGLIPLLLPRSRRYLLACIKNPSDELLFTFIVVAVGAIATFGFLFSSGLSGSSYRRPLLAAASLAIQLAYTGLRRNPRAVVANLVGVGLVATTFVPAAYHRSQVRRTNCDLAAAAVAKAAHVDDFIVVMKFTHAVTFQRYYHGPARWTSIPAVSDHKQHRWDLARAALMSAAPIQDILLRIEQELRAGHKVFLVGKFPRSEPDPLIVASPSQNPWRLEFYLDNWRRQVANLLRQHAVQCAQIPLNQTQPVNPGENEELFAFSEWRD